MTFIPTKLGSVWLDLYMLHIKLEIYHQYLYVQLPCKGLFIATMKPNSSLTTFHGSATQILLQPIPRRWFFCHVENRFKFFLETDELLAELEAEISDGLEFDLVCYKPILALVMILEVNPETSRWRVSRKNMF